MITPLQLEARALAAGYGEKEILHDVSLSVAPGELVGLIGPNGAGKTTLLRVLSGELPAMRGDLRLGESDLSRLDKRSLARRLAFVPQSLNLPVAFTVHDFVALGRRPYGAAWSRLAAGDREAIRAALRQADLDGMDEQLVDELSAGERQRALVALALAQEPQILLLDEPTAHLDIPHAWRLLDLVRALNRERGTTVIFSSHDLNLAAAFCRRLVLLDQGRIASDGTPEQVLTAGVLSTAYHHALEVITLPGSRRVVVPA
ncbi:MAG: ABC transporter ATP-binding protein [Kiritimatiellae bacterium]|nr:ABC transporter ATP-binding protein [Kiritimatiellia bacterium]